MERGLHVDAVDPGPKHDRGRTGGGPAAPRRSSSTSGGSRTFNSPEGAFAAVFSATAFHWIDPTVGWAKVAQVLQPDGNRWRCSCTSATARRRPPPRSRRCGSCSGSTWGPMRCGGRCRTSRRSRPVSQRAAPMSRPVWTWLGHHDLTSPDASALFDDVRCATVPLSHAETADQLCDFLETTSSYQRLEPRMREALQHDIRDLIEQLGGAIRFQRPRRPRDGQAIRCHRRGCLTPVRSAPTVPRTRALIARCPVLGTPGRPSSGSIRVAADASLRQIGSGGNSAEGSQRCWDRTTCRLLSG